MRDGFPLLSCTAPNGENLLNSCYRQDPSLGWYFLGIRKPFWKDSSQQLLLARQSIYLSCLWVFNPGHFSERSVLFY